MILKLCRKCKKVIKHPATYCDKCLPIINEKREQLKNEREKKYRNSKDPKYRKFYNSNDWKLLKNKKMQDSKYQCERCKKLAVEVHHIKPIQTEEGWVQRLDYDNLEALCLECHNFRHNRFQKKEVKK